MKSLMGYFLFTYISLAKHKLISDNIDSDCPIPESLQGDMVNRRKSWKSRPRSSIFPMVGSSPRYFVSVVACVGHLNNRGYQNCTVKEEVSSCRCSMKSI